MLLGLKKNNANEDEGLGRSRGGLSSKIHCVVDGLSNPVDFILTGGEVHDNVCADALLDGKKADFIMLDQDLMKVSEKEILTTKVIVTYSDGKKR